MANSFSKPVPAFPAKRSRRGTVLVVVMVVVVFLSLAAYQYTDVMTSEYRATDNAVRYAQARLLCESGVNYFCALMSNPENLPNLLMGNPYFNTQYFQDIQVAESAEHSHNNGKFSIISPFSFPNDITGEQGPVFGVADEQGKININGVMRLDPSGKALYNLLMLLPNMTDDIANSIVYWLDPTATQRTSTSGGMGSATNSYYMGLNPPYTAKERSRRQLGGIAAGLRCDA